jgi:hypothetical protein
MSVSAAFHRRITSLDEGAYDVIFRQKRYLLRKETLLNGRLIKLYARDPAFKFVTLGINPYRKPILGKYQDLSKK